MISRRISPGSSRIAELQEDRAEDVSSSPVVSCKPNAEDLCHYAEVREKLRQSRVFCDYRSAFAHTVGLTLAFCAPDELSNEAESPRNPPVPPVLRLGTGEREEAGTAPFVEEFRSGIVRSVSPVLIGERVIGYLLSGLVSHQPQTQTTFGALRAQIGRRLSSTEETQLKRAVFDSVVLSRVQFRGVTKMIQLFSEHLSSIAQKVFLEVGSREPNVVARARKYITDNLSKPIKLSAVAREVGMSTFHFCKTFRETTGIKFSRYVSVQRIEAVKAMLADEHCRINEAAYSVGFQTLSQFNRTFQRIMGENPSSFIGRQARLSARAGNEFSATSQKLSGVSRSA